MIASCKRRWRDESGLERRVRARDAWRPAAVDQVRHPVLILAVFA
jgi:hypothetical protein